MIQRILIILSLVLAVAGGVQTWRVSRLKAETERLSTALVAAESALSAQAIGEQIVAGREKRLDTLSKEGGKSREKLEQALDVHQEWASQPVPADVLERLQP